MGSVWEAVDERLDRKVALKLMIQRLARDEKALRRFEREAKAVAGLRSPHIVQLLDFGVDKVPYMVLELLEGCELKERLFECERFPMVAVARIVAQVAKALTTAHAAQIVHRDLKPANIFLVRDDDDEYVKVFDFGTAKALTGFKDAKTLTTLGSILGTPHYMAPEQLSGDDDTDARADVWSLAVVAYHALTGVHPFPGEEVGEVIQGILFASHTPPSSLDPDLPAEMDTFFEQALAKDKNARFQTARSLATAFSTIAISEERGILAPEDDPGTSSTRPRRAAVTRRGVPRVHFGRAPSPEEADQAAASAWVALDALSTSAPLMHTPPAITIKREPLPRAPLILGAIVSLLLGGASAWLVLESRRPLLMASPAFSSLPTPTPPATTLEEPPVPTSTPSASAPIRRPRPWRRPDIYEGLDK
jgi:serine/threonine protein kinase